MAMSPVDWRPPTRAALVEQYGEPDDIADGGGPSNLEMAEWANDALQAFRVRVRNHGPMDECVPDLIGDLLHLVTLHGFDADEILESARHHFTCEVGRGYGYPEPPGDTDGP